MLKTLAREKGTAMMLVTHDMGVIAETADRVAVMYAGRITEIGPVREVVRHARHPYSQGLMGSIPPLDRRVERLQQIDGAMLRLSAIPRGCAYNPRCPQVFDRCRVERPELMDVDDAGGVLAACGGRAMSVVFQKPGLNATPMLSAQDVARYFDVLPLLQRLISREGRRTLRAVDGLSFDIEKGTTLSLVGESGCGKSTVARLVVGLYGTSRVMFDGQGSAAGARRFQAAQPHADDLPGPLRLA